MPIVATEELTSSRAIRSKPQNGRVAAMMAAEELHWQIARSKNRIGLLALEMAPHDDSKEEMPLISG